MSKQIDSLVKRIEAELDCTVFANSFMRTRAGYWQRAQGAWSWGVDTSSGPVGSARPVKECMASTRWEFVELASTVEICPILN